ncbi:MAG: hypothetical protein H6734_22945, partial [Alphaproteobacteria bacterium]|nr:hypothetical protein [Alphaproteobacteria bacterium]
MMPFGPKLPAFLFGASRPVDADVPDVPEGLAPLDGAFELSLEGAADVELVPTQVRAPVPDVAAEPMQVDLLTPFDATDVGDGTLVLDDGLWIPRPTRPVPAIGTSTPNSPERVVAPGPRPVAGRPQSLQGAPLPVVRAPEAARPVTAPVADVEHAQTRGVRPEPQADQHRPADPAEPLATSVVMPIVAPPTALAPVAPVALEANVGSEVATRPEVPATRLPMGAEQVRPEVVPSAVPPVALSPVPTPAPSAGPATVSSTVSTSAPSASRIPAPSAAP